MPSDQNRPERRLLIEAMLLMVAADGEIHDDEIAQLGQAISEHQIFEHETLDSVIDVLRTVFDELANEGFESRLRALADGLSTYPSRLMAFALATRISFADGDLDTAELDLLRTFQTVFGLKELHVQTIVDAVSVGDSARLDKLVADLWQGELSVVLTVEDALVEVMLLMAAADGEVQTEEATQLALTLANNDRFNSMSEDDISAAIGGALERIQSDGMPARLSALEKILKTEEERKTALRFAYQILAADGVLAPGERECLDQIRRSFGLSEDVV